MRSAAAAAVAALRRERRARPRRSCLYVPGTNAGALRKARTGALRADAFIFDLEDAVAASAKPAAREQVAAALGAAWRDDFTDHNLHLNHHAPPDHAFVFDRENDRADARGGAREERREREHAGDSWGGGGGGGGGGEHAGSAGSAGSAARAAPSAGRRRIRRERIVRVNGLDTPWGLDDLRMVSAAGRAVDAVAVPKVECAADVWRVERHLEELGRAAAVPPAASVGLALMIETPKGVLRAAEIAAASENVVCLIMGTSDLTNELRAQHTPGREPMLASLGLCVLAARAHGVQVRAAVLFAGGRGGGVRSLSLSRLSSLVVSLVSLVSLFLSISLFYFL
jgi:citrate lyase beta subunit